MVNDETLCSMRNLTDFVIDNKIENLFDDALTVRKWQDADSVAFGICPRCNKESMEISGEGITSDGKHYPMEECLYCDFVPTDFKEYSGTVEKATLSKETKDWLIDKLENWDETFDEGEETDIPKYINKIKEDEILTAYEYSEVLFHLWQIFYDME